MAITKLKVLRMSKKISQTELAEELGISRSLLALIESRERNPQPEVIQKLERKFNIKIETLLEDVEI